VGVTTKVVLHVVGARPNFMKTAPVMRALERHDGIRQRLVHTGQHYDRRLAEVFFEQLGLPRPDYDLGVGSGTHAEQTAAVMIGIERLLAELHPQLVVVVGDVNSTLAAAVAAAKAGIPIAHVEAGLRSFDCSMPEEINRVVTDRLSRVLLTPSQDGDANLVREGVPADWIHRVGNVMIDSLRTHQSRAPWALVSAELGLRDRGYAVLTLHRPANVDDPVSLGTLLDRIAVVAERTPIVFPIHPRTARRLEDSGLVSRATSLGLKLVEPLGYLEFIALLDHASCVLTDSGGIQEETTVLGVPCFTLRDNTERPVTIEHGTNTLVGADGRGLAEAYEAFVTTGGKRGCVPPLWDGRAGERAARVIEDFLNRDQEPRGIRRPGY
jgi:UDP-N-acetylglucosamine 2-epimerase (non-hydrolysing)